MSPPSAAAAPKLDYAVEPFQSWGTERSSWAFLLAACIATLFADATTIPLPVMALYGLYLAAVGGGTSIAKLGGYFLLLSLFRGIPAADYLRRDISWWMAYVAATMIAMPLCGLVLAAALVQKSIWLQSESTASSSSSSSSWSFISSHGNVFAFPTLCTALFQILSRISPIGEVGNPAFGVISTLTTPSLVQLACVFGEMGLVFWVTWMSSLGAAWLFGRCTRRQLWIFAVTTAVVHMGGAWRSNMVDTYQQGISEWSLSRAMREAPLQVSCLTATPTTLTASMIQRTNERLAAGDDLIVWSEGAGQERISPAQIDWPMASNPGAVVAVTFLENATTKEHAKGWRNSVELLQANTSLWRYDKNRPVPIVEPNMIAGKEPPTCREVTFSPRRGEGGERTNVTLKVAAAICFDFDFPYLFRPHAHDADLVVGPSEYWGSLGQPLWADNVIRAIENGFSLFKCSADGISGAVDPRGRTIAAFPTVSGSSFVSTLPVAPGISTVYANYGGYVFGWLCVLLTPFWLILSCWPGLFRGGARHVEAAETETEYTSLETHALNGDDGGGGDGNNQSDADGVGDQ